MKFILRCILATGLMLLPASRAISGVFYPDGLTTLHFAFEGSPSGDRPIVRPPAFYRADDGFGFVDSPGLTGIVDGVVAPKYFRFDVNLPPGNYDVGVTLGGTESQSITTVKAEGHRPMLLDVGVGPRNYLRKNFTVNVRGGDAHASQLELDARLNLEFVGVNPSLEKLDIKPNDKAVTVFIAGGASACDEEKSPAAGWGQMLGMLFKAGEVAVSNQADASASAQSFIDDHRLDLITKSMKAGDCLLIDFDGTGAEDSSLDATKWKGFLKQYVDAARGHSAIPILITANSHGRFTAAGKLQVDMNGRSKWTRELAQDEKVAIVDLGATSAAFLEKLGTTEYSAAFSGENDALSPYGAFEFAKLVAIGIQDQKLELASHLMADISTNSDPAKFPAHLGNDK